MAKLYIAMYKPTEGNYEHWALYLDEGKDKEGTIFEVTGQHPSFEPSVTNDKPENTRRHVRNIHVGTINAKEIKQLKDEMKSMPIDNDTVEWNCQDYCIESIDKLNEEGIIDDDDKAFKKGRKQAVDKFFGPL